MPRVGCEGTAAVEDRSISSPTTRRALPAGPLAGMRVLDCTHVIAGAWCSMLLADLGADVIKIEPPKGEVTRTAVGPFRAYDFINRNKRAIAVDMTHPDGAATLRRLAGVADVWVENFRPGALDRLGLGYADLARLNPSLIYCSISGFGHDGPYRDRGGLDLVAQAMSGIMSFVGEPGGNPVSTAVPISDLNAGTFGALGVVAAWAHRQQTGEGQRVETTLLEAALAYTVWESGLYLTIGEIAEPRGSRHRLAAPYEALRTGDGHVVVGVNNQSLWRRFCEAIGQPALCEDARFRDPVSRVVNREQLKAEIEAHLAGDSSAHWLDKMLAHGIPCGPINTIDQALADPQVQARGIVVRMGDRDFLGSPLKLSRTPTALRRGPAEIGEHSREVLREAGFSAAEVEALLASGAVAQGAPAAGD
jgi:crotonobetainyl-CoA:carnitine CoA-transferase CaiB-like acyl-CoA transferase